MNVEWLESSSSSYLRAMIPVFGRRSSGLALVTVTVPCQWQPEPVEPVELVNWSTDELKMAVQFSAIPSLPVQLLSIFIETIKNGSMDHFAKAPSKTSVNDRCQLDPVPAIQYRPGASVTRTVT